jgi:cytochrome c553
MTSSGVRDRFRCRSPKPQRGQNLLPPTPEALHEKLAQHRRGSRQVCPLQSSAGQKDASVCRHCHGVGGNSVLPEVPNLASQNAGYLLEQMNKFVHGQRKSSAIHGRG